MSPKVRSILGLTLAFLPGGLFILGLLHLNIHAKLPWGAPWPLPWEVWGIAVFGTAALLAAAGDWHYHLFVARTGVSPTEEKTELIALGFGGLPLFLAMAKASLAAEPRLYLIPVIGLLLFTTVMICRDELLFHRRRCGAWENFLHKVIVGGNGLAWLAWFHWVFVRVRPV